MAAQVEFHSGVGDKIGYACRLLRKATARGARVVVSGEAEVLRELDSRLWTFDARSFVPHARLAAGQSPSVRLTRTPVWLVEAGAEPPHRETALHLGRDALPDAERYARVIDLVGDDADDRGAGRRRWRAYEAQGLAIQHHARGSAEGTS